MTMPRRLVGQESGELIAAVPALLSFTPTESIVLITYTGTSEVTLQSVLRVDLPTRENIPDIAQQLQVVARNHTATVAELIMLGGETHDSATLPHRPFVEHLTEVLLDAGIVLAHTVWAPRLEHGLTWRCYEDPDCNGQIGDPASSPLATAASVAGAATFATRAELAAQLEPDPVPVLARRAAQLAAQPAVRPEHEFPFIRDTIDTIADVGHDPVVFDDDTIVRLVHALSHPDVRQACLAFALTARARPAERLWTTLTRTAPTPIVAEPAILLAVHAYLRGDGALAQVALDAALNAAPEHAFAQTLRHVMDYGLPPDELRLQLAEALVAAFTGR